MTPNSIAVINAVKAQFPGSGPFGGYRPGDPLDHGTGHAVDIMCSTAEGNEIAAFLQANAGALNVKYLIWRQRIWYPGGSWQGMEDRGSPTANHYGPRARLGLLDRSASTRSPLTLRASSED